MRVWTRALLVIALASGCKDKAAPPAPADKGSAVASVEDDLAALESRFHHLLDTGDDVGSVAAGKALVDALRAKEPASHRMLDALTKYGMQLQVTGDWKQALVVLEEALAHPAASKDRKLLAEIKFQLGSLYTELHEADKAIGILRSAVDLSIAEYGADASETAVMKESLASALDFGEHYAQAEPLFREVLATYEKEGDPRRIGRATTNLAVNLEFQDRDAEALELYMRGVEAMGANEGYERSSLAEAHSGVGRMHQRQKQYKAAIAAFEKALAIRIEVLGADHPLAALDYHNLAVALRDAKNLPRAREMCGKALAIRQAKLPAEHPYRVGTEDLCAELGLRVDR